MSPFIASPLNVISQDLIFMANHYMATHTTYLQKIHVKEKLETKFIQKENLVLISQSNKLYI